jgi:two-component system cell cycle sensor histidine kinase/response regulator CckA
LLFSINGASLLQIVPYFLSILISLLVGIYALRKRYRPAAFHFGLMAIAMGLYTLFNILSLLSLELNQKIILDAMLFATSFVITIEFFHFAIQYTGYRLANLHNLQRYFYWFTAICLAILITEPWHNFVYGGAEIASAQHYTILVFEYSAIHLVFALQIFTPSLVGIFLFVRFWQRSERIFRAQSASIILGMAIIGVGSLASYISGFRGYYYDYTPLVFAINNIIITWALFRFRFLDLIPVAREVVIERMQDGVIVVNNQGIIIDSNKAVMNILNCHRQALIGKPASEVFPSWPQLEQQFTGHNNLHCDIELEQKHTILDFYMVALSQKKRSVDGRVIIIRDITKSRANEQELDAHRHRLEATVAQRTAELQAAYEELKHQVTEKEKLENQFRQAQKMEAVGRLAGGMAHDFNNLITIIKGFSDLMISDASTPENVRKRLQEISGAADRAGALTRQLLAFARKQVSQPRRIEVNSVIKNAMNMLHRLIGVDIDVRLNLTAGKAHIFADPHQLEQVIINLIVNARDAINEKNKRSEEDRLIEILTQHYRGEKQANDMIEIKVVDNGIGIPAENLDKIFEPFFTTKEKGKGTGLGLSTVFGIIKQNKGQIFVDSEVGKGTFFTLRFPLTRASTPSRKKDESDSIKTPGKETILFVDDEKPICFIVAEGLAKLGYEVLTANNVDTACEIISEHGDKLDIVVSDMVMPGKSGFSLWQWLQSNASHLPFFLVSGFMENDNLAKQVQENKLSVLSKPFTIDQLARQIRQYLEARANK